jgi:hypothetical protein
MNIFKKLPIKFHTDVLTTKLQSEEINLAENGKVNLFGPIRVTAVSRPFDGIIPIDKGRYQELINIPGLFLYHHDQLVYTT